MINFNSLIILGLLFFLGGCISENDDLHQWVSDVRLNAVPQIPSVQNAAQFFPQEYKSFDGMVPFDRLKLTQVLRYEVSQGAGSMDLVVPELSRRKDVLEMFPLDSVVMTGSMNKEGAPLALLMVDGLLYQVRLGNYVGQNYGKIVGITETSLQLREIVQNSIGDWEERMITLELKEDAVN